MQALRRFHQFLKICERHFSVLSATHRRRIKACVRGDGLRGCNRQESLELLLLPMGKDTIFANSIAQSVQLVDSLRRHCQKSLAGWGRSPGKYGQRHAVGLPV